MQRALNMAHHFHQVAEGHRQDGYRFFRIMARTFLSGSLARIFQRMSPPELEEHREVLNLIDVFSDPRWADAPSGVSRFNDGGDDDGDEEGDEQF